MPDIRVNLTLPRHHKYRRLRRLLGPAAMEYLICFWSTVADQVPNGKLKGWSPSDVEDAAGWAGEPGELTRAMVESGLLDKTLDGYTPHDWTEHQGWVVGIEARKASASKAGKASVRARSERIVERPVQRIANGGATCQQLLLVFPGIFFLTLFPESARFRP